MRPWIPLRRAVLATVAGSLVLPALIALVPTTTPALAQAATAPAAVVGPTLPNILLVNMDDARYDALNFMPKTRSWMFNAHVFTNARVDIPSCCPSRGSLFTGRYPHNDGITQQSGAANLDSAHTLMAYLKGAGYLTAMTGKFLNSWPGTTAPPYFDKHTIIKEGYYNTPAWVDGTYRYVTQYSTTFLGNQLRSYLTGFEAQDSRPWFAYFAPQAPHIAGGWKTLATPETKYATTPVAPCAKPGEADRTDKPAYVSWSKPDPAYVEALCESQIRTEMSVDDEIAKTFVQIKAAGELPNTVIIVTSDNGNNWGEQGWFSKFMPYEPSVRVPLMIRWDGHVTAGNDARLVGNVDIMPSIMAALGLTPTVPVDGRSFFGTTSRADFFTEYFYDTANGPFPAWASLTSATRKYVETYTVNANGTVSVFKEYYRLTTDPTESVNVLKDGNPGNDPSASELATLSSALTAARTCVAASCP